MKIIDVDIILPCYNPPKGWEMLVLENIRALQSALTSTICLHTIIVNDGSINNLTSPINFLCENLASFSYLNFQKNKGKGAALKEGLKNSESSFAIYTDIDFPYDLESMLLVIQTLVKSEASLIIGTRSAAYYEAIPEQRKKLSRLLKKLNKRILNLPAIDTQAGLKGLDQTAKKLFCKLQSNRYLIDLEFIKKAYKEGIISKKVEIKLKPETKLSKMPYHILLKESTDFIKILLS